MKNCSRQVPSIFNTLQEEHPFQTGSFVNSFIMVYEYFYRPQRSWGKVIFSEACVKNSVHRGDLPHCMLGYPTPRIKGRHPPEPDIPPGQCMWGDTGNKRAVRILLECNLVFLNFSPNFLSKARLKLYLIDNHHKSIMDQSEMSALPEGYLSTHHKSIIVTVPLGLWMFERPGELRLNHSNVNFRIVY